MPQSGRPVPAEEGLRWQQLDPAQRAALKPLERSWAGINANQKQKWAEIATRFPSLQPDEKARIQARMGEWAELSTEQRRDARVNFQQAQQVAPQDRRSRWEAYQALPPEERSKLAARAAPRDAANLRDERSTPADRASLTSQPAKANIVPNPAFSAQPTPVAPTVQQAQPGATTTLISRRPVPPAHQQTGLPKIDGGANSVDNNTLLPQRGPQGAAPTRPAGPAAANEAGQRR
ncbi:MAG: hypothetical protein AD742_13145 [Methylibium sp. NZG]|nr:MAG: hypothetical protein AD742_13145 [Methylibium sp. NZG]